jgi:rhamnose utilization protein RhaD (predicted bifunctional aldolase and dehydrogenase)
MSTIWRWIIGIVVVLGLLGLVAFGGSDRRAYHQAKGMIEQRVQLSQERIDIAVQMATKSVDLALVRAGNLPSQQAMADLIKQDIEEIGSRLDSAAQARGDLAVQRLDESIEQFNTTLQAVEDASNEATDPAAKSILDRIYGMLEGAKEQLTQTLTGQ